MKIAKPRWLDATRFQLPLLFTLAIVLSQLVSLGIINNESRILQEAIDRFHLLERTASDVALLNSIAPEQRQLVIGALSDDRKGRKGIQLADAPWRIKTESSLPDLQKRLAEIIEVPVSRIVVATKVTSQAYCKEVTPLQPRTEFSPDPCESDIYISARLDDGIWLNLYVDLGPPSELLLERVVPGVVLTIISVIIITSLTLGRITRPLQRLSRAAEKVGRGERCLIPESGPEDVKKTISAFNDMQEKLNLYIKDRTYLMAAISHDLHTPITTMRLRVELLPEHEDKAKLLETLREMEMMTSASLDFVRESNTDEQSREVDINALLASICDDLHDAGLQVEYQNHKRLIYSCRGQALRRALTNLIRNGVTYGHQVKVELIPTSERLEITISDKGEGIPEEMHEQIFEPFVRLEQSRNRGTGGTGLGMSIARTIIRHHGGDIELLHHGDGFTVLVTLP